MEFVSNLLIWLLIDVLGIKILNRESNALKKVLKGIVFVFAGYFLIVLYFAFFGPY